MLKRSYGGVDRSGVHDRCGFDPNRVDGTDTRELHLRRRQRDDVAGEVYRWDGSGEQELVGELPGTGEEFEHIAIVPEGWGEFGGQLIGTVPAGGGDRVVAMDLGTGVAVDVVPGELGNSFDGAPWTTQLRLQEVG